MLTIKNVVIGTFLVGVGAVIGYFISRKLLEEQYRIEIAKIRALYQDKMDELEGMIDTIESSTEEQEDDEDEDEEPSEEDSDEEKAFNTRLAEYRGERRPIAVEYNKRPLTTFKRLLESQGMSVVVAPNGDENLGNLDDEEEDSDVPSPNDPEYEEKLDQIAEDYARRRTENMKNEEPYLIEPDEYREGPEEYTHQTLYYYAHDRTLCEDDDTEFELEEECVGFDYEDVMDTQMTCWVRNDKISTLYEIHRIDDSYRRAVLNVSETPREREFRLQGRRKQAMDDNFTIKKQ